MYLNWFTLFQFANAFYNAFVKRNSRHRGNLCISGTHEGFVCVGVFVSTIFVGAFAFGIGFDVGITSFWDRWNKGVRDVLYNMKQVWFPHYRNNGRTSVIDTQQNQQRNDYYRSCCIAIIITCWSFLFSDYWPTCPMITWPAAGHSLAIFTTSQMGTAAVYVRQAGYYIQIS
jgi:ubiquinol-cytochrome c reductase subunit 9